MRAVRLRCTISFGSLAYFEIEDPKEVKAWVASLTRGRRDGKSVPYRLSDAKILALMDLIRVVAERNLAQVECILRSLSDGVDVPEPVTRDELAARLVEGSVTILDVRPPD